MASSVASRMCCDIPGLDLGHRALQSSNRGVLADFGDASADAAAPRSSGFMPRCGGVVDGQRRFKLDRSPENKLKNELETTEDHINPETEAVLCTIHAAMHANNQEVRKNFVENFMDVQRQILSGRTFCSWKVSELWTPGAFPNIACDFESVERWILQAVDACRKETRDMIVPGTVEQTPMKLWEAFLRHLLYKLNRSTKMRYMQSHLIQVLRLVQNRIRSDELQSEVMHQISTYKAEKKYDRATNAKRSWQAVLLNTQKKRDELQLLQKMQSPHFEKRLAALISFFRKHELPLGYAEFLRSQVITNQWLSGKTAFRIKKVLAVQSEDPFEAFYWEMCAETSKDIVDPKHRKWFRCVVEEVEEQGKQRIFVTWFEGCVLHLSEEESFMHFCHLRTLESLFPGRQVNRNFEGKQPLINFIQQRDWYKQAEALLRDGVAVRQRDWNFNMAPARSFFGVPIHLPYITETLKKVFAENMIIASDPLPFPDDVSCDFGDGATASAALERKILCSPPTVLRMCLFSFVISLMKLQLTEEEQEQQLMRVDEPPVDDPRWSEWEKAVRSTFATKPRSAKFF